MSGPKVMLGVMPWKALTSPSLPLGLLRSVCREHGRPMPSTWYGSLRWAEFLLDQTGGEITPDDYGYVSDTGIFHSLGDWVFGGVLTGDEEFGYQPFLDYLGRAGFDPGKIVPMRALAAAFIAEAAAEITSGEPDIVGFSTTFMQNVPTLALAQRIKQIAPDVTIVLGGGNCDGPMGAALHRNHPFIDFVLRGEGEEAFPFLLDTIGSGQDYRAIPGLCWRDNGTSVANPEQRVPLPPGRIPMPDYADWAERFADSPVRQYVQPSLILESSRGCWWGEAHQCTFCGLNGTLMEFRSKSADRVIAEIETAVRDYKILDITMVDNIADNASYTDVFPRLAKLDWDLRIQYEIKSNLRAGQARMLREAHVLSVQPGIESLSSGVLRLMDKGVRGPHNVRALRDLESEHVTVSWNWLYGFPGELASEYTDAFRQLPRIVHLQPPQSSSRILLERFSPNFDQPALGFVARRPAEAYQYVYDLPAAELADLAYLFDTDETGIGADLETRLQQAVADWTRDYRESFLSRTVGHDRGRAGVQISDRRAGWPRRDTEITDPVLVRAYLHLEHGRTVPRLLSLLAEENPGVDTAAVLDWIDELDEAGLIWREGDHCVTLATWSEPVKAGQAA
jgi:ribosomal peptide maturation radical SAM protein 1